MGDESDRVARIVQFAHAQTNIVDTLYEWEAEDIANAILASDWLAERVRLAQEQAWKSGYEHCEIGTQKFRNPYTQGNKQA